MCIFYLMMIENIIFFHFNMRQKNNTHNHLFFHSYIIIIIFLSPYFNIFNKYTPFLFSSMWNKYHFMESSKIRYLVCICLISSSSTTLYLFTISIINSLDNLEHITLLIFLGKSSSFRCVSLPGGNMIVLWFLRMF